MQNAAPVQLNQVRDFGQIISSTFQFLKQEWRPLFRALAVICLPPAMLAGFFIGKTIGDIQTLSFGDSAGDPTALFSGMMAAYIPIMLGYVLMFFAFMMMIAVTYEYLRAVHLGEQHMISTGELFRRATGQLGSYIGTGILSTLLMGLGFVLCILPGFYVLSVLSLAFSCHAMERSGGAGSLSRSYELVKDKFWEVLGLVIVIGLIQTVITYMLMLPFSIVTMVVTFNSTFDAITAGDQPALPGWMAMFTAISTALQLGVSILSYPIVAVGLTMKYFSLKEQKEGSNLREKVAGFDQA